MKRVSKLSIYELVIVGIAIALLTLGIYLANGNRSADIYLNGELTVDFPEDVRIPIEPNQMATAAFSGNKIKCALL